MRLPTYNKPRIIACAEDHPQHIGLPRGCLEEVRALLKDVGIAATVRDERQTGQALDVTSHGAPSGRSRNLASGTARTLPLSAAPLVFGIGSFFNRASATPGQRSD